MSLLVLLWSILGQQPAAGEIERLIQELENDDIGVRERAADQLVALGAATESALRRVVEKSPEGEAGARARSILGEIRLLRNRDLAFGSAYRVSLPEGDYTLRRLAESLKEQNGITIHIPQELSSSTVRLGARNMLFWEFLDRLSRAHGGIVVPPEQPQDAVNLVQGKPVVTPVHYSGPFRISIEGLRLERRRPGGADWDRGGIVLALAWQPNVRPIDHQTTLAIDTVTQGDGAKLEVNPELPFPYDSWQGSLGYSRWEREFISFSLPKRGVRTLGAIRGSVKMLLPLNYETVVFEHPLLAVGKTREAGKFRISLKKFEHKGDQVTGCLQFSLGEGAQNEEHDLRLPPSSRFGWRDAVLVSAREGELENQSNISSSSGRESLEQLFTFKSDSPAKALRVRFLADYFEKRVEFEFKDVELP